MSKKYSFEFSGTKEMFLNLFNKFPGNDNRVYYFDGYIIEISENEICFGVARGGHSGGYWFIPTITESDNKTTFCGEIQRGHNIDNPQNQSGINKICEFLIMLIMLPFALIAKICFWVSCIVRKIFNHSKPKEESPEDRLYNLMENHLNCTRK